MWLSQISPRTETIGRILECDQRLFCLGPGASVLALIQLLAERLDPDHLLMLSNHDNQLPHCLLRKSYCELTDSSSIPISHLLRSGCCLSRWPMF